MERAREALAGGLQCLRFFNSDMYYSAAELQLLLRALDATTAAQVSTASVHKSNSFRESRLYTTYPLLPRVSVLVSVSPVCLLARLLSAELPALRCHCQRRAFFGECLRLRQREKRLWGYVFESCHHYHYAHCTADEVAHSARLFWFADVVVAAGDDQGYAVGYDTDREGGVGRVARSGVGGAGQRSATPCRRCGANRPAASYVSPWPRLVRCQRHC